MAEKETNTNNNSSNELIMKERKRWGFFGIPWTFTKYLLRRKKLVIQTGLLRSVENEILLYRIVDITYSRALFQKLFRLGTIVVHARDKTTPVLVIKNIRNSRKFKETLAEMVEQDRIRMKMRQSEFVDAGMPDLEDYADDDF